MNENVSLATQLYAYQNMVRHLQAQNNRLIERNGIIAQGNIDLAGELQHVQRTCDLMRVRIGELERQLAQRLQETE